MGGWAQASSLPPLAKPLSWLPPQPQGGPRTQRGPRPPGAEPVVTVVQQSRQVYTCAPLSPRLSSDSNPGPCAHKDAPPAA